MLLKVCSSSLKDQTFIQVKSHDNFKQKDYLLGEILFEKVQNDVVLILGLCSGGQKFLFDHTDCNASVVKDCFPASFKKNIQDLYFKLIKMN